MVETRIEQQEHGYRSGHQLLSASLRLQRDDQDLIDRLSDMSGQLRPGETFASYLTTYPLPSRSHYVVARTWQDLEAPRAGCVRTRSLLVPIATWDALDGIARILPLLTPVHFGEKATTVELPEEASSLPEVIDPRTIELVEALFLEERQPIVFFEIGEPEAVMARVLAALWPALKRNFATCTFTLAPRRLESRDFDLVFAPRSARTRFADWTGRRIDASSTTSDTPRHRWSIPTWKRVFQSDHPSLIATDALGALRDDTRGDEATLRLSLLWNELVAKADRTPSAVLGMLDILNRRHPKDLDGFKTISGYVRNAIGLAATQLEVAEGWRYLSILLSKLADWPAYQRMAELTRQSSLKLTERDYHKALEYLEAESRSSHSVPPPILSGIGEGLSRCLPEATSLASLSNLSPDIGAGLIEASSKLAGLAASEAAADTTGSLPTLVRIISSSDRDGLAGLRAQLLPFLNDANLAPLLPPLLSGVSATELTDFAKLLGRATAFAIAAFDEPLGNAARDAESLLALRDAVATEFEGEGADRLLLSTLSADSADIGWLQEGRIIPHRASTLLSTLLERASDRTMISLQRDATTRDRIIEILLWDLPRGAPPLARLILLGDLPIETTLDVGLRILPAAAPDIVGALARYMVSRAFVEARPDDHRIGPMLEIPGLRIPASQIAQLIASRSASTGRVASNLMLIGNAPSPLRLEAIARIDDLSDRLVHRSSENLGVAAYTAWALMVADAGSHDDAVQLEASLPALALAMRSPHLPVSPLVRVTFPIVYAQLLRSKGDEDFGIIPRLMMLPMSYFVDWDRAKSARHDLADVFLSSSWPPSDLLLTAIDAGIEHHVLKRLSRSSRGNDYIHAIQNDIGRLSDRDQSKIYASLMQHGSRGPKRGTD